MTSDPKTHLNSQNTSYLPVAGFWRRLAAASIDMILFAIIGQIIGLLFTPALYNAGLYGRLIGLAIVLPYITVLNSRMGGGQTIGKRLLKIAVRGADNRSISLPLSLARASILILPFLLGGWPLPWLSNSIAAFAAGLIVLGLGGALIYTLLFNSGARQGLHDLLCQTYVVVPDGVPEKAFPKTAFIHRLITIVWMFLAAVTFFFLYRDNPNHTPPPAAAQINQLRRTLAADPRFFSADVRDQTITPVNDPASRALVVEVWTAGQLAEDTRWETGKNITAQVLRDMPAIDEFDQIQVKLTYGYDIGIASYRSGFWYSNPVDEWRIILSDE